MNPTHAVSVNTILPKDCLNTFEGHLLSMVLSFSKSDNGVYFFANYPPNTCIEFDDPNDPDIITLVEYCNSSDSEVANILRRAINEADEGLSEPLVDIGDYGVSYAEILKSLANTLDIQEPITAQYALSGDRVKPGTVGGGAFLITKDEIKQMDSHLWLIKELSAENYRRKGSTPKP